MISLKLSKLIQLAYSAERAAAFAYQGHARSVKDPIQKESIAKIEADEWQHRDHLKRMMKSLGLRPSPWLEARFYVIGKAISWSCLMIGYFMPMYFAGRLESGNVNEYIKMAELAQGTALAGEMPCMLEMARVEKEHEIYFLKQIERHRLLKVFQWIFRWGPNRS